MYLTLNFALVVLLALVLFAIVMYRKWLDDHEDHNIHLHNTSIDSSVIMTQQSINKRLEVLEKAIRYLTIVVITYAVVVAGMVIYHAWLASNTLVN